MDAGRRERILSCYAEHAERFDAMSVMREVRFGRPDDSRDAAAWSRRDLSKRELDVLELVAAGYANIAIARRLCVSEETVKTHVRSVLSKLPARNRAHAVAIGLSRGYIQLSGANALRSHATPRDELRAGPSREDSE